MLEERFLRLVLADDLQEVLGEVVDLRALRGDGAAQLVVGCPVDIDVFVSYVLLGGGLGVVGRGIAAWSRREGC